MKTVSKLSQILAAVFGLAALVLFCFTFAEFTTTGENFTASGLQLGFGAEVIEKYRIAHSADILLCFWLSVLSFALSVFSFFKKGKTLRYWLAGISLGVAIYMLVITLSNPWSFVDTRPFTKHVSELSYGPFVAWSTIALFLAAAFAIVHMFVYDYLDVVASKNSKKPLLKRVLQFFKDYKSEVKKIVWPGPREVVKNTLIVLLMCLVIGVIIWLVDWGLGSLLSVLW